MSHWHVTTHEWTLRQYIRLAVKDTIDTLQVGETMRRLRHQEFLSNTVLTGVRCSDAPGTDLTISTYDRWSLRPILTVQSNSSYGGVEEKNLFGTGRQGSVYLATREGRVGGAVGFVSPYLLSLPLYMKLRVAQYPDGDELRGRFQNAEQSVFDTWRSQLIVTRYRRDTRKVERVGAASVLVSQAFHREGTFLLFGRRLNHSQDNVTSLLFGADFERASLNAPDMSLTVGPKLVERRYYGPKIGLGRRAAAFDTVGWLAERQLLVDIPLGVEFDALIGAGREDVQRRVGSFGSAWLGKMWIPARDRLLTVDLWSSGYLIRGRGNFDAASSRALLSCYQHRGNVVYSVHGAAEKLVNPDPDVRALATFDPTIAVIPTAYRLSENAFAGEIERAQHFRSFIPSLGLDGALFVAGSLRTASALSQKDQFGVTVIGTGFRLVPTAPGSGSLRIDLMYPVLRNAAARGGAAVAISVTPWLEANRQREDPRLRQ